MDAKGVAEGGEGTQVAQNEKEHPLQNSWSFWLRDVSNSGRGEGAWSLSLAHTFSTVEGFWSLINSLIPYPRLNNVDFYIFRKGIFPDYEDNALKHGGRVLLKLPSNNQPDTIMHDNWVYMLLALIGEVYHADGGLALAGLRLVYRKGTPKYEIWTTSKNKEQMERLCRAFLGLELPSNTSGGNRLAIEFESFDKSVHFKVTSPSQPSPTSFGRTGAAQTAP